MRKRLQKTRIQEQIEYLAPVQKFIPYHIDLLKKGSPDARRQYRHIRAWYTHHMSISLAKARKYGESLTPDKLNDSIGELIKDPSRHDDAKNGWYVEDGFLVEDQDDKGESSDSVMQSEYADETESDGNPKDAISSSGLADPSEKLPAEPSYWWAEEVERAIEEGSSSIRDSAIEGESSSDGSSTLEDSDDEDEIDWEVYQSWRVSMWEMEEQQWPTLLAAEDDKTLDAWDEKTNMRYWQREGIVLAKLAAELYVKFFQEARQAYLADPREQQGRKHRSKPNLPGYYKRVLSKLRE
ncbi:Uu.00g131900.m01.CDS01 [Anthostomella pinea]|uniref:Uu.00g131900.m01.CDS01 n=1 Tax=Anthostomella pinea TaxID=933095 RepID=A0AAI8VJK3_9PEZI|nr:Uu.00g131900.m01.CDS01 [Anthostomella pinea]